jgi:hypothetical protein
VIAASSSNVQPQMQQNITSCSVLTNNDPCQRQHNVDPIFPLDPDVAGLVQRVQQSGMEWSDWMRTGDLFIPLFIYIFFLLF